MTHCPACKWRIPQSELDRMAITRAIELIKKRIGLYQFMVSELEAELKLAEESAEPKEVA